MASFAPALLARLRDDLVADRLSFIQIATPLPLVRTKTIPFSGGSDHMITNDPAVGIPTPMLIQWPDSFYHTTADVMEMVDERSLWLAGTLAGSYLMWLANAGAADALWLGWELLHGYERDMAAFIGDALAVMTDETPEEKARSWARLNDALSFQQDRMSASLQSLLRLAPIDYELMALVGDLNEITDGLLDRARHQVRPRNLPQLDPKPDAWAQQAASVIPKRLYRGPIMEMGSPRGLFPFDDADAATWQDLYRQVEHWRLLRALAEYWVDGQRSLAEIARLVELESGQAIGPAIETYFNLLAKAGMMTLERRASEPGDGE
jgi:hypothetical protein